MIIQDEVKPYEVVGLFDTEDDADRFIHQYAEQYGLDDVSHLEKYRADLSFEGQGPVSGDIDSGCSDPGEAEQVDFSSFDQ